jgi:hypothetical protein
MYALYLLLFQPADVPPGRDWHPMVAAAEVEVEVEDGAILILDFECRSPF